MSQAITAVLQREDMVSQSFWTDVEMRGDKVAKYRRYMDGDFDANFTPEMRRLLRVRSNPDNSNEFGANYCDTVVTTMADRLTVDSIVGDSDSPQATEFIERVAKQNRFDGFQIDVMEAGIRDGESFVMVHWDNERQRVLWTHEPAYDGVTGIIPVYARTDSREIVAAVKVWQETRKEYADTIRVNFYFRDRIEKYEGMRSGGLRRIEEPVVWLPGEITIVPFTNRARGTSPYGLSELEAVIPLQDMLVRCLYSLTMAAELSAFPIRVARGFVPPPDLTIGMWLKIADQGLPQDQVADVDVMPGAPIQPYLDQARFLIEQIHDVTKTPRRGTLASNASGEALKQDEIGLLSKVRRAQVKFGSAWEEVARLSALVARTFGPAGSAPGPEAEFFARWANAEVRDDMKTVQMAMMVRDLLGDEETLRQVAGALNIDASQIGLLLGQRRADRAAELRAMMLSGVNTFGERGVNPINGSRAAGGQDTAASGEDGPVGA